MTEISTTAGSASIYAKAGQGFTLNALDPLQFADLALDGAGAGVAAHPLHAQAQHEAAGRAPAGVLTRLGRRDT